MAKDACSAAKTENLRGLENAKSARETQHSTSSDLYNGIGYQGERQGILNFEFEF